MAIKVRELLAMTPDGVLKKIGKEVCVDKPNQKLTGMIMYKVMLYTLAKTTRISLRIMETIYKSPIFQSMTGTVGQRTRHSSFADRLSKIKPDYFAEIFEFLVSTYNKRFTRKDAKNIYRFDSTIIGLSARLFSTGMNYSGLRNCRHVKVTIGQKGTIPNFVRFYTKQEEAAEDIALKCAIREAKIEDEDFVVFDRGLSSGKTFLEFSQKGITFITRINANRKVNILETMEESSEKSARKTATLSILSDQKVQIMDNKANKFCDIPFRLIKTKSLTTDSIFLFLTNDFSCTAQEITEFYKRRWDIEVFFRFIKQELNFKHFLARKMSGFTSYLYMVLILAILLLIYKTLNNRIGYKIVKMDFTQELENEVIGELIRFCGGDKQMFFEKFCSI